MRYLALLIADILSNIMNRPLAPIAVLFASDDGWLPRWLWWLQTPDNSLDGDEGWKAEHRPFMIEDSKAKRWWNRTRWMHRNSMYGFAIDVLGAKTLPSDVLMIRGDTRVSNRPLRNGLVVRTLYRDGSLSISNGTTSKHGVKSIASGLIWDGNYGVLIHIKRAVANWYFRQV